MGWTNPRMCTKPKLESYLSKMGRWAAARTTLRVPFKTFMRGFHVYQEVWRATVGQVLPCQQERGNVHDQYSISPLCTETPWLGMCREISTHCSLFLRRNSAITFEVTLRTCEIPPPPTSSPNFRERRHYREIRESFRYTAINHKVREFCCQASLCTK